MEETKLNIKPEFLTLLGSSGSNISVNEKVNLSLAIFLFTERAVTLARAAELVSMSIGDFIKVLINHNIPWADYTNEHMEQDAATIQYILEEENKNG
jgi:predicted HTH domain antitoxin